MVKVNHKWFCCECGEKFDFPFNEIGEKLLRLHMSINHPPKYPGYMPTSNDKGVF